MADRTIVLHLLSPLDIEMVFSGSSQQRLQREGEAEVDPATDRARGGRPETKCPGARCTGVASLQQSPSSCRKFSAARLSVNAAELMRSARSYPACQTQYVCTRRLNQRARQFCRVRGRTAPEIPNGELVSVPG